MNEIGSEFYLSPNLPLEYEGIPEWLKLGKDQDLVFTGRTAIDYVLEDFESNQKIVYFPSYCCDSMLQPFLARNMNIQFYDVSYNNGRLLYDIDINKKCDVFVAMNYFGFTSTNMNYYISKFAEKDIVIIEDITHSLLSKRPYSLDSDYLIASLRKWFAIPSGGLVAKVKGRFRKQTLVEPPQEMVRNKIQAMQEKYHYIYSTDLNNKSVKKKEAFLMKYSQFNNDVRNNYKNLAIDNLSMKIINSLNIEEVIQKRKENTKYLIDSLKNINYLKLMIASVDFQNDCPLFLPVIISEEKRDSLRKKLIDNQIYLPVHWPIPQEVKRQGYINNIYLRELSLVCDQRYDLNDMDRMVKIIGGYQ